MTTQQIKNMKKSNPREAFHAAQAQALKIVTRPQTTTVYFVTGEYLIFRNYEAR